MAENESMPVDEKDSDSGGNMDVADESDSDSSDSDADNQNEQKISELQIKLSENPYMYDLHVEMVKLLRQAGELDLLRAAREKMNEFFPLSEELWMEWLKDEMPLATSEEDRPKIEKLFERATADYLSVPLWLEYVQFSIGGMGAADGVQKVRAVFERALAAAGRHTSQGANIWEAYREFENAILAGLMPQPGASVTKEQEEAFTAQNKRVDALFKRQLAVPLLDMEETIQEYKEWSGGNLDPHAKQIYDKALKQLETLRTLESDLLAAEPPRWEEFQALIKQEMVIDDPARIQCVFERAVKENCLNPEIWMQYTKYMDTKVKIPSLAKLVYERALRNCPWSSQLWQKFLLMLERSGADFEKMKETMNTALKSGLTQGADYLLVWTTYCDYLRRRIKWEEEHEDMLETLRISLEKAVDQLQEYFGTEGDPTGSLRQFWALIEGKFCKNMEKARELWNSIMTEGHGNSANMWMEYYKLERMCGDAKHCRKLLQRALNSVNDWPEAIAEAYINFEREEGNLETYDIAVSKCDAQLQRIAERREKAAEKESFQEEQKKHKPNQKTAKQHQQQQTKPQQKQAPQKQTGSKQAAQKQTGPTETHHHGDGKQRAQKRKMEDEFKAPAPPGPKGEPPPGFRGEVPAKKLKEDGTSHGVSIEHDRSKDSCTAFVSNLSYGIDEDRIREIFNKCGEVTEIRLVKNYKGQSKGYAYVVFKDEFCVSEAFKLDRELVDGRPMFVSKCEDRTLNRTTVKFKYATNLEKNKLFIRGLPFTCTKEAVTNIFSPHGTVKDVRLVTYRSGAFKGIAYVEYETEAEAAHAVIKTDNLLVGEHTISVAISNPPARKLPESKRDELSHIPSLGGGKKTTEERGKARTQVALLPRSVARPTSSKSADTHASASAITSDSSNGQTGEPKKGMSNADFRSMLLKK